MLGWHHKFNGHELEQTPEKSEERGARCAAVRGVAKSDMAWRLTACDAAVWP